LIGVIRWEAKAVEDADEKIADRDEKYSF